MNLRLSFASMAAFGAALSFAQVSNGGFESGLTGWTSTGDVQLTDATLGSGPFAGTTQALIASHTDPSSTPALTLGNGLTGSALEANLGLTSGSLFNVQSQPVVLASAVSQTVHLAAHATVSFAYDFITNQVYKDPSFAIAPDPNNNDFAFYAVVGSSASVHKLNDVFDGYAPSGSSFNTNFTPTGAPNPFLSELGYKTASFQVGAAGDYTIVFGAAHAAASGSDNGVNSALLLDNVSATPEPSSMLALGGLLAGVAMKRKKANG